MNPVLWIRAFAVLSITALTFVLVSGFWIPMLAGALAVALLRKLVR